MKITKYVHACILAQDQGVSVLFDPGEFTWESHTFSIETLVQLDAIVITHEHFDHFSLPFVQALLDKFPNAKIISTPSVVARLEQVGIAAQTTGTDLIQIFSAKGHAPLDPLGQAPENIAVHFAGRLTVGGDRHDLEESKDILALTVAAPWGSTLEAVRMAYRLQPKHIIPVHDWHWNDSARKQTYKSLETFFGEHGIKFHKPQPNEVVEV